MATANDVLNIARGEIGYSRWNDPETGTKYGRWYAQYTGQSWYGANGVAYCAMFVSWVFNQAGATAPGLPGAYCPWIVNEGRKSGQTPYNENAQPGDLVLFDWEGDGVSDHIGIVESNHPSSRTMTTIEGNTNNGCVARRTRAYSTIVLIIHPNWSGGQNTVPAPSAPTTSNEIEQLARDVLAGKYGNDPERKQKLGDKYDAVQKRVNEIFNGGGSSTTSTPSTSSGQLEVDGVWGPATTRRLQEYFGTECDGIVSDQYVGYKASSPGLSSATFEWHNYTSSGSDVMRKIQAAVGVTADGFIGPDTMSAMQRHFGTYVDGYASYPSEVVKAMQRKLNGGAF